MDSEVESNWFLLWLILLTTIVVKVLRACVPAACRKAVSVAVQSPAQLPELQSEMKLLKKRLSEIDMIDCFADHAKLQRVIRSKETKLTEIERSHSSKTWKLMTVLQTASIVFLQLVRIGVIVVNRQSPVTTLPVEQTWPLASVLSFPTGVQGVIGAPFWGLMCMQAVDSVQWAVGKYRT